MWRVTSGGMVAGLTAGCVGLEGASAWSVSLEWLVEAPNILFSRPPSREDRLPLLPARLMTCYEVTVVLRDNVCGGSFKPFQVPAENGKT